jgi:sec-independent protein translocase protein TatC
MTSRNSNIASHHHDEDFFADSRMSFGDHIEDLRSHLLRAVYGFLVAFVVAIFLAYYILDFIKQPVERALEQYHMDDFANEMQRKSLLLQKVSDRLDAHKPGDPLSVLDKPTKMPVQMSPVEMDKAMRKLYPQLFQEGGPLANAPAPAADAPMITVEIQNRPLEVMKANQEALVLLSKRMSLTTLSVMETFFVYVKVAVVTGFVIGSPWIMYQIWLFVAAGLYPHERKYFYAHLPLAIFLFFGGVALCQFAIIPAALDALLAFNKWLSIEPDLRLSEWLSFAIWMPVITGLCFETPLAMVLMHKIGLFTSADFKAKWRHAAFVMCIISAIFSPSVDPFSLLLLWGPMVALYFLGIYLVKRIEQRERLEDLEEEVPYQPAEEVTGGSGN